MSLRSVIVCCGPSGTGKSTLLTRLLAENPGKFGYSVSHTTRSPRPGEDSSAYNFVTRETFLELIKNNDFIEHAEFSGNFYGTSVKAVQEVIEVEKKICILDIDTQGVKLIKAHHSHLSPLYIFISPPSLASLKVRLKGRGTESEVSLAARLSAAVGEVKYAKEVGAFDLVVVNDDLERAFGVLKGICVEGKMEGDKLPDF